MMEELIKKRAEEMGIDAEDLIIIAMSRKDPQEGVLTLARKYMAEAEEYLKKGDSIQFLKKCIRSLRKLLKF